MYAFSPPREVVAIHDDSKTTKDVQILLISATVTTIGLVSDDRGPTCRSTSLEKTGGKTTCATTQLPHARRHTSSTYDCVATIKGASERDRHSDEVILHMLLSRTTGTMAVVHYRGPHGSPDTVLRV